MATSDLPPPAPPKIGGEVTRQTGVQEMLMLTEDDFNNTGCKNSPRLDKEGVGGGRLDSGPIHNKLEIKSRRKALRNEATAAEQMLWSALKHGQLGGYKFRRQHSVGCYILDFYCPSERLAIEIDGDSHFIDGAMEYDNERTAYLNSLNIRVLRFLNTDVYNDLASVCERIINEIG